MLNELIQPSKCFNLFTLYLIQVTGGDPDSVKDLLQEVSDLKSELKDCREEILNKECELNNQEDKLQEALRESDRLTEEVNKNTSLVSYTARYLITTVKDNITILPFIISIFVVG